MMEKQLFNWESWDDCGECNLQFSECTLKVDIGPYKAGSKIPLIYVGYNDGNIIIYNEEFEEAWKGKLILSVA
jgi:hypothetical protein